MALFGPYNVVNDGTTHDPLAYKILTGTFDFADDRTVPGGKKWWMALKGAPNAHGSIVFDPGTITGVTVTAGGSGYTSAPTVVFTGGSGTGAAATAVVSSTGVVTGITLTSAGSGYLTAPVISFSGGGGTGLAATVGFIAGKQHVDASAALVVPGVKGVYWGSSLGYATSWTYYGAIIAGVVAEDWETARYACSLIKVDYNTPKTVVFDADKAMLASSPIASDSASATSNVSTSTSTRPTATTYPTGTYSDTAAFANAEVILGTGVAQDTTNPLYQPWTSTFQHNPLHAKTGLSYWIGDDCYGFLSSQDGMGGRATLQSALGIPLHKCHVITHGVGGGHGDGNSPSQMTWAARASQALNGHPVTCKISRQAHNLIGSRQFDSYSSFKIGAKKDGTIVAWTGASAGVGGSASWYGLQKTYIIPNISIVTSTVTMNVPGRGPWRCVGDNPGCFNYDAAIDKLAAYLGLDPWAVRMKNLMPDTMPDQDTAVANGRPRYWSSSPKGVNACFTAIYQDSGYAAKWHQPGTKVLADGRMHGIALVGHQDSHGSVGGTGRWGHLRMGGQDNTGKCFCYVGGSRASVGPQPAMMHIVAEVLGLLYTDVTLAEFANSDINLTSGNQVGSGHTGGAGTAFYNTALDMRARIFARAVTLAPFATITPANVTTKATATANISGGGVASITITNPGAGYSGPPSVTLTGGGGVNAKAVADINSSGAVTSIIVTNPGVGYTTAPTVNIYSVTPNDLDAKNSSIFLIKDPTQTITYATATSGADPFISACQGWSGVWRKPLAAGMPGTGTLQAQLGDTSMSTGSCAACVEVAVDTDTGVVEVTGFWNYVHTGTSIWKTGCLKEIGAGTELTIGETLFYGDVYDPLTAAVLQMSHGSFMQPSTLDLTYAAFHILDVQAEDMAAPCGGRGMAEPCASNISAVNNAIFNATGKWVNPEHGAMSPDKVLKALGKA